MGSSVSTRPRVHGAPPRVGCEGADRFLQMPVSLSYSPILDALAAHPDHNAVIAASFRDCPGFPRHRGHLSRGPWSWELAVRSGAAWKQKLLHIQLHFSRAGLTEGLCRQQSTPTAPRECGSWVGGVHSSSAYLYLSYLYFAEHSFTEY